MRVPGEHLQRLLFERVGMFLDASKPKGYGETKEARGNRHPYRYRP
jgi:hypothetical protein